MMLERLRWLIAARLDDEVFVLCVCVCYFLHTSSMSLYLSIQQSFQQYRHLPYYAILLLSQSSDSKPQFPSKNMLNTQPLHILVIECLMG